MNAALYIVEYIKRYQKVEVIGLGVFFVKNAQAQVDEASKTILPPSQEIGVDINFQTEGKSLERFIAKELQISEADAQQHIFNFSGYVKKQIDANGEVVVEGLGKFVQTENEIKFYGERIEMPSPDFYGLEEINISTLNKKRKKTFSVSRFIVWVLVLVIPILAIMVFVFDKEELIFGKASFRNLLPKKNEEIKAKPTLKEDSTRIINDSIKINTLKIDTLNNIIN